MGHDASVVYFKHFRVCVALATLALAGTLIGLFSGARWFTTAGNLMVLFGTMAIYNRELYRLAIVAEHQHAAVKDAAAIIARLVSPDDLPRLTEERPTTH